MDIQAKLYCINVRAVSSHIEKLQIKLLDMSQYCYKIIGCDLHPLLLLAHKIGVLYFLCVAEFF